MDAIRRKMIRIRQELGRLRAGMGATTLSTKSLAVTSAAFLCALIVAYFSARHVLLGNALRYEDANTRLSVQRALDAIRNELAGLEQTTADWAAWDDTYAFVRKRHRGYAESNLHTTALSRLRIGLAVFADTAGQAFHGGYVEHEGKLFSTLDEAELRRFSRRGFIPIRPTHATRVAGVLVTRDHVMLVATHPVTNSPRTAPVNGSLTMGRLLDAGEIKRLSGIAHLPLTIHRLHDPEMPPDVREARAALSTAATVVRPMDEEVVAGYALLRDVKGLPALVLRVTKPRTDYRQAVSGLGVLLAWLLFTGAAFAAVSLFLLRRIVLCRIEDLSSAVHAMSTTGEVPLNVPENGSDEVACLGRGINWILASLRESREELEHRVLNRTAELDEARCRLETAYSREHRIANTLQQALITDADVDLPGFRIVVRYKPGMAEAEVGGDFYDIFQVGATATAIALGDVSGKGLAAAIHTAMAKYMLRAYAHENPEPAHVLERLNMAVLEYVPDELFITVFLAVLDHEGNRITYANGGHDQPLLYRRTGNGMDHLDVTGAAMGVMADCKYEQKCVKMGAGDLLVVYTDGVTDARQGGKLFGIEGLSQVTVEQAEEDEHEAASAMLSAAEHAAGGNLLDDAAVLLVKTKD